MKHCILVKYNESVDSRKKEELISEISSVFAPLTDIKGIHKVEVIPNIVDRANRYDLLIRIDMEQEILSVYDESQPHKVWKKEYSQYLEKKAIFDYE